MEELLKKCTGFDWDEGNESKNASTHKVSKVECEQIFFNKPLLISTTYKKTDQERYLALGTTREGRFLTVIFALRRQSLIRVISARDMSRKERGVYEKAK